MRIDAHTHIFAAEQRERRLDIAAHDPTFAEIYRDPAAAMATPEELVAEMAAAGLDRVVAAGFAFRESAELAIQADTLLAAAGASAGRVLALAPLNLALADWRAFAAKQLDRGARGFGELRPANQGWDPLGAESHALCEMAAARRAVLLWHVSEPVGHAYPGKRGGIAPYELCLLAEAHPGTWMVAAHLGGGLSFYLQMPELQRALQNLYFDTAAASLLYDGESIARLVAQVGARRVMFGSDYPLLSPGRQMRRIEAALAPRDAQAVLGGTAETLFSDTRLE